MYNLNHFKVPIAILADRIEYPRFEDHRVFVINKSENNPDYEVAAANGGTIAFVTIEDDIVFVTSEFLWAVGSEATLIAIRLEIMMNSMLNSKSVRLKTLFIKVAQIKAFPTIWLKAA